MSTVDPRIVRQQKAEAARASGAAYVSAIVFAVVHFGLWALAGYGGGIILDTFRLMAINVVGHWDGALGYDLLWMFFVGVFGGAFLGFVLTGRMSRVLPVGAILFPFVTAFLGVAAGLLLFVPRWTAPDAVGHVEAFLGDDAAPWDAGGWIMYWMPWWLPILFAVLGLLVLWLVIRSGALARRKAATISSMIQAGVREVGAVSEVIATGTEIMGNPLLQLTVRYTDATGTPRWVTKRHVFPVAQQPRVGDVFTVWYDPNRPGDEKSIVLAAGDSDGRPTA